MATFFGEVLPVISRAVEEDDDNDSESECFERFYSDSWKFWSVKY